MKSFVSFLSALLLTSLVCAQSVPNGGTITQGQVWTAPQWTTAWQSKADALNGVLTSPSMIGAVNINGVSAVTYQLTPAEIALGVTPINSAYPAGNCLRYACDPTGISDSTAPIQTAINVVGALGGAGIVDLPMGGTFSISSTLVIGNGTTTANSTINNVFLRAVGSGGPFTNINGTRILWNGSVGGTMVEFQGGGVGGGILGSILLDGNNKAATGLYLLHWAAGHFQTVGIKRCTGTYLKLYTQTVPDTIGGVRDNIFDLYFTDTIPSGAIGLSLDALTTTSDALQNTFDVIDIPMSGSGATGIYIGFADFNDFRVVDLSAQTTVTNSIGINFVGGGPVGNTIFPSLNTFGSLSTTAPVVSNTSGGTPYGNYVSLFDLADSNNVVPTAAGLYGTTVGLIGGVQRTTLFGSGSIATNFVAAGSANTYALEASGNATSGQSFGLLVNAGTTSADISLSVCNQANTTCYFGVRGDGLVTFAKYTIGTLPTCNAGASGAHATVTNGIASPTYQQAVSATGAATQPVFCSGSAWIYD